MDNQNDYTVAFALVAWAEAMVDALRAAGKLEAPSQTRRQTRTPERLCQNCGKQGHRANACTAAPLDVDPVVIPAPVTVATVAVKPAHVPPYLSPDEAARITKITVPGSRYHPRALGVADVKAIERCRCNGETHRIALLNNGRVAILDHSRRLFRLQGWAVKSAGHKLDGCWAKLAWLQENAKRTYGDHGMLSKAVGGARKRDEKQKRERNPVEHERGKSYLAAERATELAQYTQSIEKWRKVAVEALRVFTGEARFGNPSISHTSDFTPTLHKHTTYSGRTQSSTLKINVVRWYATVFKKNLAKILKNMLVLDVLDTDVLGRPSQVVVLRKNKGVECVEAVVKYGPTGRGRLVATATLTQKGRGY